MFRTILFNIISVVLLILFLKEGNSFVTLNNGRIQLEISLGASIEHTNGDADLKNSSDDEHTDSIKEYSSLYRKIYDNDDDYCVDSSDSDLDSSDSDIDSCDFAIEDEDALKEVCSNNTDIITALLCTTQNIVKDIFDIFFDLVTPHYVTEVSEEVEEDKHSNESSIIPEKKAEVTDKTINKYNRRRMNKTQKSFRPTRYGIRPTYFDWRDHHAISPVKDQGGCAACWAFSIVANVESMLLIYENRKEVLSEKFLIDCETDSNGCANGSILRAYANIIANIGGILRNSDYLSYNGRKEQCAWKRPGPPFLLPVTGFSRVKSDEDVMAEMLFKYGPLSAAINSKSMETYGRSHDIDEPTEKQCPSDLASMDHSILIVGYNVYVDQQTGHEVPYWIIKNSWGTRWGDNGFYYLVRGRNACGIANDVSYAKVN